MSGIHQFVPMLHRADAVGRHTVAIRDALVAKGVESSIFVEGEDPQTTDDTQLADRFAAAATGGDLLVYQMATASDLAAMLVARSERLVVNYHNITPPESFAAWSNPLARHQLRARQELVKLAGRTSLAVAVSAYNRAELDAAGFGETTVVPPVTAALGARRTSYPDGSTWLTVGRLAPNKRIEDLLIALFYARRQGHDATLVVVGRSALGVYVDAVRDFAHDLGVSDYVTFAGAVDDNELERAYAQASVLVVASEHEGFCLPVVEAMARGVPVVANRAGAIPEIVGEAGMLVDTTDPGAVVGAITTIGSDMDRRNQLIEAGVQRVEELGLPTAADTMADLLIERWRRRA